MESQQIEQVNNVPYTVSVSGSKVRNAKRITLKSKPCIYFKDVDCRAPMCDMKVCEKCPEGTVICTKINFIKSMLQKVLMFLVALLIFAEI